MSDEGVPAKAHINLAQMTALAAEVERDLIESGGEITQDIENKLQVVESQLPAKVDAYDFLMRKFERECELWRDKADQMNRIAMSFRRAGEALDARILFAMENAGLDEVAGHHARFKLQKSPPAMEVVDESRLPEAYFEAVITKSLKKDQLKRDLKDGIPVSGARLTQSRHLRRYPVKGSE